MTSRVATRLLGHSSGDSTVPVMMLQLGRRLGQGHPLCPFLLCPFSLLRHAQLAGMLFASQLLGQRPSLYIEAYSSGL